jgi:hypothetical protein
VTDMQSGSTDETEDAAFRVISHEPPSVYLSKANGAAEGWGSEHHVRHSRDAITDQGALHDDASWWQPTGHW